MDAVDRAALELWIKYGSENIEGDVLEALLRKHGAVHHDGYNTPQWLSFYERYVHKDGVLARQTIDEWLLDVDKIKELIDGIE